MFSAEWQILSEAECLETGLSWKRLGYNKSEKCHPEYINLIKKHYSKVTKKIELITEP